MLSSIVKEHQQQQQIRKQELGNQNSFLYFLFNPRKNKHWFISQEKKRVHAIESTNKFAQFVLDTLNKE